MNDKSDEIEEIKFDNQQSLYPSPDIIGTGCVHQIWMQGLDHLLRNRPQFHEQLQHFKQIHGENHIFWSEKMIIALITDHYPQLLPTYHGYEHFILRVDLAKYIILHFYGGFYCDMDTKCKRNFAGLTLMTSRDRVLVCRIVDDARTKLYKRKFINNHFFYVPVRFHPLFALILTEIPKAAKRKHLEPMILYVLRATGPGFIMKCIEKYRKQKQNVITTYNKKHNLRNPWPLCGKLQSDDVVSIIRSDVLNNYFVHESKNTWLEKQWLDDKDKHNVMKIGVSTAALCGASGLVFLALLAL